jgi:hypothetical protein
MVTWAGPSTVLKTDGLRKGLEFDSISHPPILLWPEGLRGSRYERDARRFDSCQGDQMPDDSRALESALTGQKCPVTPQGVIKERGRLIRRGS